MSQRVDQFPFLPPTFFPAVAFFFPLLLNLSRLLPSRSVVFSKYFPTILFLRSFEFARTPFSSFWDRGSVLGFLFTMLSLPFFCFSVVPPRRFEAVCPFPIFSEAVPLKSSPFFFLGYIHLFFPLSPTPHSPSGLQHPQTADVTTLPFSILFESDRVFQRGFFCLTLPPSPVLSAVLSGLGFVTPLA